MKFRLEFRYSELCILNQFNFIEYFIRCQSFTKSINSTVHYIVQAASICTCRFFSFLYLKHINKVLLMQSKETTIKQTNRKRTKTSAHNLHGQTCNHDYKKRHMNVKCLIFFLFSPSISL